MKLRSGGLLWAAVGDEVVLLDRRRDLYLAANPAAAVLWPLLERGCTLAELVDALVDAFAVPRPRAEGDVASFVAALKERDLIDDNY